MKTMDKFKVSFIVYGKNNFENKKIDKKDVNEMLHQIKNDWYVSGAKIKITAINKLRKARDRRT